MGMACFTGQIMRFDQDALLEAWESGPSIMGKGVVAALNGSVLLGGS